MPPSVSITKEKICKAAFSIVKAEGLENLTARRIAKELGCSTRPIYQAFDSMQEIHENVIEAAKQYAFSFIDNYKYTEYPFLNIGLGYLNFAHEEKMLFKTLFLSEKTHIDLSTGKFLFELDMQLDQMRRDDSLKGLSDEQLSRILKRIWIYSHGIAALIAANSLEISNDNAIELLGDMFFVLLTHEKSGGVESKGGRT